MDFTLHSYRSLLENLQLKYNLFDSFASYVGAEKEIGSISIFRHDVDLLPENSLITAEIENSLGIKGSYYFRVVPESYDLVVMQKIADLGHEIGYHYEDVDLVSSKINSNDKNKLIDAAYENFCKNLEMFRKNFEIKTVCMHGSPKAKYDNKIIWEKYDYRELGLLGEPYYDIDFNEFGYLTDTGRRWNGNKVSVRDKVDSKYKFDFKTTGDIIENIDSLPPKMMFTVHPQRWTDNVYIWSKELVTQNLKNIVKRYFYANRNKMSV